MNHIHQQRIEIARLKAERNALQQGIDDLRSYLSSDKFNRGQNMVNSNDVLLRLREIESASFEASDAAYSTEVRTIAREKIEREDRKTNAELRDEERTAEARLEANGMFFKR